LNENLVFPNPELTLAASCIKLHLLNLEAKLRNLILNLFLEMKHGQVRLFKLHPIIEDPSQILLLLFKQILFTLHGFQNPVELFHLFHC
jgi:hypothetical protein